ncbi:hypothetical protein [Sphingomonas bacterium]|uniref:hypothetical protein n=1 Tax=Sphingomonas bacterium TaxID=1895847 RepID=UPI001576128B|nr:hypothetical protein [Sphingomonas bacterium]
MTDQPIPDPSAQPLAASRRHDGWTIGRQAQFLAHLSQFGGVAAAAKAVGISAKSAYRLRHRSAAFATAWDAALDEGRARSFDRAVDRGINGYVMPIYRGGRLVGHRHRYDNRLAYAACYAQPMPRS